MTKVTKTTTETKQKQEILKTFQAADDDADITENQTNNLATNENSYWKS